MTQMTALICPEPGALRLETRPRPDARDGHVRVRIGHVGICGTDYHIFGGQQPFLAYPRVMGHELSGRALDASSDGTIAPGDLVDMETLAQLPRTRNLILCSPIRLPGSTLLDPEGLDWNHDWPAEGRRQLYAFIRRQP